MFFHTDIWILISELLWWTSLSTGCFTHFSFHLPYKPMRWAVFCLHFIEKMGVQRGGVPFLMCPFVSVKFRPITFSLYYFPQDGRRVRQDWGPLTHFVSFDKWITVLLLHKLEIAHFCFVKTGIIITLLVITRNIITNNFHVYTWKTKYTQSTLYCHIVDTIF